MTSTVRVLAALMLSAWVAPQSAFAQVPREGRAEVSVGLLWVAPVKIAAVPANEVSFGGQTKTVFDSRTQLDASPGLVARFGVGVASALQVEGVIAIATPHLSTRLTGDDEAPGGRTTISTASETITQYIFEGGLAVRPVGWRTRHVTSFVTAGAGYVRNLHEGQTLLETGQSYYVGAGATIGRAARPGGKRHTLGLRVDARAMMFQDGVSVDRALHVAPAFGAALFVRY